MPSDEEITLAQILWDFHKIDQPLEKADLILGLGSYDLRVADHCAKLALEDWAPLILFTGAQGNSPGESGPSQKPKCSPIERSNSEHPRTNSHRTKATNTGDNVRFTRELLAAKGIEVTSVILVSKPNMNRRGFATMEQWWPEAHVICNHPETHFLHSPAEGHTSSDVIDEIVGDLQRIIEYPRMGFQTEQEIQPKYQMPTRN